MLSRNCNKNISQAYGLVEMGEKNIQQSIRLNDESLLRRIVRAKGVPIDIGRRNGNRDHVGYASWVFPEFFSVDEGLRKVELILNASGASAYHFVKTSLGHAALYSSHQPMIAGVEIFSPLRKIFHPVRRSHPLAAVVIHPKCTVCGVATRE